MYIYIYPDLYLYLRRYQHLYLLYFQIYYLHLYLEAGPCRFLIRIRATEPLSRTCVPIREDADVVASPWQRLQHIVGATVKYASSREYSRLLQLLETTLLACNQTVSSECAFIHSPAHQRLRPLLFPRTSWSKVQATPTPKDGAPQNLIMVARSTFWGDPVRIG